MDGARVDKDDSMFHTAFGERKSAARIAIENLAIGDVLHLPRKHLKVVQSAVGNLTYLEKGRYQTRTDETEVHIRRVE